MEMKIKPRSGRQAGSYQLPTAKQKGTPLNLKVTFLVVHRVMVSVELLSNRTKLWFQRVIPVHRRHGQEFTKIRQHARAAELFYLVSPKLTTVRDDTGYITCVREI